MIAGQSHGGQDNDVNLLSSLYEPSETIYFNMDYLNMKLEDINLGVALSRAAPFSGSIRDNIRYGKYPQTKKLRMPQSRWRS